MASIGSPNIRESPRRREDVENGQEFVALWLPMTREEKAAQLAKAEREGVNVSQLVAEYLRGWAKA